MWDRSSKRTVGALLAVAVAATALASSPDPRPSSYFGTLTSAGAPVAPGLLVTAEVGGGIFGSTETFEALDASGQPIAAFLLDVPADLTETPDREGGLEGETVAFRVEGVLAPESALWSDGSHLELDLTVAPGTDLAIEKTDDVDLAAPGDTLTYRLTISNLGPGDATGVVIEDVVPIGTSFVVASDGGTEAGGVVSWPSFDLSSGEVVTRTVTFEVAFSFPPGTTHIINAASVSDDGASGLDPDPSNNVVVDSDLLEGGPDVAVSKVADVTSAAPGQDVVYTLTLTNDGFQDAEGVVLTDQLPPEVLFQTASDDGIEVAPGTVEWPPVTVAVGAVLERTVRVRVPADLSPGIPELVNTASVSGVPNELDPSDDTDVHVLPIPQDADLAVVTVGTDAMVTDPQSLEVSGHATIDFENLGLSTLSASFEVTVFEDLDGDGVLSGADAVLGSAPYSAGLAPGEVASLAVPLSGATLFLDNRLFVFLDSADQVAELDETNNVDHSGRGCEAIPTPEDFAPVVEYRWPVNAPSDAPSSADTVSTPLVAQLTDDNGDGRRDDRDIPDLVFVTYNLLNPFDPQPRLRAVRGDTGADLWSAFPPISGLFQSFLLTGSAVADIDLDGRPEIIVCTSDFRTASGRPNRLTAYEHNGTLKWVSAPYNVHPDGDTLSNRDQPTIADVDGDGTPEILVGATVFNNNGTVRWAGAGGQAYQSKGNDDSFGGGAISVVADVDLDGAAEVVTGNTLYEADGTIQWQIPFDDGYPAVANFDDDDFAEIVVVAHGTVRLHEHDGTLIWGPVDLPGSGAEAGGAPTIGNFDADPEPEIGVAGSTQYAVFEADGTIKWQSTTQDGSSNATGSTVFDLDGNGTFEVIYRDETHLRIYRGEDGVVLWEQPISSQTMTEEPIVVDVDRDGNAEIVVSSDALDVAPAPVRTRGIFVVGDSNDNWVAARPTWNQHAYSISNVAENGHTIPAAPEASWLTHNTFRANVAPLAGAFASPDLSASRIVVDASGYPTIQATVRVGNGGTTFAPAGVAVSFYDADPASGGALLGTATLSGDLDPGEFEDVPITFDIADVGGGFGTFELWAAVDEDGSGGSSVGECDEANNVHGTTWSTEVLGLYLELFDGLAAVQPGEVFTYELRVTNGGALDRAGTALTATLPPHLTFVGASDGGSETAGTVTWPLFDAAGFSTVVRTLTVAVDPAIPTTVGSLTTSASVTDDGALPEPTPANNTASDTNTVLTVSADAGGPYAGDEGNPILVDGSASSDRDGTVVAWEWDFDGDGVFEATGVTAEATFPDNGTFTIVLRVTDDSGEQDTDTAEVLVANLPATVEAGPDQILTEGDAATLDAASFIDPGTGDTHTATVDWGDGTSSDGFVTQTGGSGTVAAGHDYPDDGVYLVEVCVTDDDGATGCDSLTLTVENSNPVVVEEGEVDLHSWTAEHLTSAGNWVVTADGTSVTQTVNTNPSVFYGPFTAIGVRLEGVIRVDTSGDDDFIGFVLGFQPGDFSNPNADYLLFDWKQGNQAPAGGG